MLWKADRTTERMVLAVASLTKDTVQVKVTPVSSLYSKLQPGVSVIIFRARGNFYFFIIIFFLVIDLLPPPRLFTRNGCRIIHSEAPNLSNESQSKNTAHILFFF